MPNAETFSIPVFWELVTRVLSGRVATADPFARRTRLAKYRNDLDPECGQEFALDSRDFGKQLKAMGVRLDGILFDPPYSPRQISECYRSVGLSVGMEETQSARLYSETRDALDAIADVGCMAVSFGWNSVGFGKERGWELEEVHLVCHGGAHNDTIAVVERKARHQPPLFPEAA
jgi:hypothetical protein